MGGWVWVWRRGPCENPHPRNVTLFFESDQLKQKDDEYWKAFWNITFYTYVVLIIFNKNELRSSKLDDYIINQGCVFWRIQSAKKNIVSAKI